MPERYPRECKAMTKLEKHVRDAQNRDKSKHIGKAFSDNDALSM